jgi:hypothetical protein
MSAVYFYDDELPSIARNGVTFSTSICDINQRVRIRIGNTEVELDEVKAREFLKAFEDAMKRAW